MKIVIFYCLYFQIHCHYIVSAASYDLVFTCLYFSSALFLKSYSKIKNIESFFQITSKILYQLTIQNLSINEYKLGVVIQRQELA